MRLLFVLFLIVSATYGAALSFEAEELQFTLQPGYWEVDGLFYFANYAETTFSGPIFFPVPVDSLSLAPELLTLEITEDSDAKCRLLSQSRAGFSFNLEIPELHFCTLHLVYRQELKGDSATYIITSARAWGQPFEYASYDLRVDPALQITELPFPLQEYNDNCYHWEILDFTPDTEFRVRFAPR